jgi:hypothetical protein
MWCQDGLDLGDDGATETLQNDTVVLSQHPINKDAIDRGTMTLDDLEFQNGAVEPFLKGDLLLEEHRGVLNDDREQIRDALELINSKRYLSSDA